MSPEQTAMHEALKTHWTKALDEAALREGWCLSDATGSQYGPLQIQRIDNPEDHERDGVMPPYLDGDTEAWAIVIPGKAAHHEVAMRLVGEFNPGELALREQEFAAGVSPAALG